MGGTRLITQSLKSPIHGILSWADTNMTIRIARIVHSQRE